MINILAASHGIEDVECFVKVGSILAVDCLLTCVETTVHNGHLHHRLVLTGQVILLISNKPLVRVVTFAGCRYNLNRLSNYIVKGT